MNPVRVFGFLFATAFLFLTAAAPAGQPLPGDEIHAGNTDLDHAAVPGVHPLETRFERIVVLRIKHGEDLLKGIEQGVAKANVKNGVILSGMGSLTGYQLHVVSNTTFPSSNAFFSQNDSPCDLLGTQGYVVEGRVHAHVTLSNVDKAFGGHLEEGTKVFTYALVTLGVLPEKDSLRRFDDKTWR